MFGWDGILKIRRRTEYEQTVMKDSARIKMYVCIYFIIGVIKG